MVKWLFRKKYHVIRLRLYEKKERKNRKQNVRDDYETISKSNKF